ISFCKTVKPILAKVEVWPSLMGAASADAFQMRPLAQDAAQAAAYPCVNRFKRPPVAMLEVLEPSPQRSVHVLDDSLHAVAVASSGFRPDGVLELLRALRSRPAGVSLEVISEKLKAFFWPRDIHKSRLLRVQRESALCREPSHHLQRALRLFLGSAQYHKVVRIAHH